jgi:prepilin-type N-terminal cleavage/methylation domain-containing protein
MHRLHDNVRVTPSVAFTLIELVTVIAVVAVLATMLLPVLARQKSSTQSSQCFQNTQQLIQALLMYSAESADYLPPNHDDGSMTPGELPDVLRQFSRVYGVTRTPEAPI